MNQPVKMEVVAFFSPTKIASKSDSIYLSKRWRFLKMSRDVGSKPLFDSLLWSWDSVRVIWIGGFVCVGGGKGGGHCCLVISQLGDHHLWSTFSPGSASVPSQVGDVINKERHWRENNEFLSFHCF